MQYINTATLEYPITEYDIRVAHGNVSFPSPFVPPNGYAPVSWATKPEIDAVTQFVTEVVPKMIDGAWVQQWEVVAFPPEVVDANQAQKIEADLIAAKAARHAQVAAITVTTQSGKVFDGNEDAQSRLSRAITAMDDGDELPWVLSDNTVALVGKAEMREALRMAGGAMAAIWVAPYSQP